MFSGKNLNRLSSICIKVYFHYGCALQRVERGGDIFGKNINELIWPTNTKICCCWQQQLVAHIYVLRKKKENVFFIRIVIGHCALQRH